MEFIFLVGSIVLLLLFLFNKNTNASNQADQYRGAFFPGGQVPYQPGRVARREKEGPFTAVAYAILFVLTLFAFMQMTQKHSYTKNSDIKYNTPLDDKKDNTDDESDVVVIRP